MPSSLRISNARAGRSLMLVDADVLAAQADRGGPDVGEAMAEDQPAAEALIEVILASSIAQERLAGEGVGLIEEVGLGEADAGVGRDGAGLEADAEVLPRADRAPPD